MNRKTLVDYLEQAEVHVADGKRHIARQHALIARLRRGGHDTALADTLLQTFEQLQSGHVADRDRINAELTRPAFDLSTPHRR